MHSFWGQGELNSWCLFTITPFWKLTLTNVNIELPCVIIALALEDWPSHRQSICYVITLLRTLFCKQYFFSRSVFFQPNCYVVTLLRALFFKQYFYQSTCHVITLLRALFCKQYFYQSTCHVITLLRAFFYKQYFSQLTVTLLRYYERFSVNIIFFRVDLLRYCERFSYYLSRPVTLQRQLTPLSLYLLWGIAITVNRSRVTLTVFIMRYSYHT